MGEMPYMEYDEDQRNERLRNEWLAILGDLPACNALWREQLEAIVDALLPSMPSGPATREVNDETE